LTSTKEKKSISLEEPTDGWGRVEAVLNRERKEIKTTPDKGKNVIGYKRRPSRYRKSHLKGPSTQRNKATAIFSTRTTGALHLVKTTGGKKLYREFKRAGGGSPGKKNPGKGAMSAKPQKGEGGPQFQSDDEKNPPKTKGTTRVFVDWSTWSESQEVLQAGSSLLDMRSGVALLRDAGGRTTERVQHPH